MKFISNCGNLTGTDLILENYQTHILKALDLGFDVKIDVWYVDDNFFLGSNKPKYKTDIEFLKTDGLWCHAKNINALYKMLAANVHCFWHQFDDFALTSKNYIWTRSGKFLTNESIAVILPYEIINIKELSKCAGICSDNILKNKKELEEKH